MQEHGKCVSLRLSYLLFLCLLVSLLSASNAQSQENYFYKGLGYGSDAVFNPLSILLNEGYGIIQLDGWDRDVHNFAYLEPGKNVFKSIANPFKTISRFGYGRFLSNELLPLSFKTGGGGQWLPNYQLHLLGGGMVYAAMGEWYHAHSFSNPKLMAFATVTAVHLLNETVENNDFRGYNADAVADMYFFDLGGMLLFSSDRVKHFLSESLNFRSWLSQPSITFPGGELQNNGQFYSMKWALSEKEKWHLFYYFGLNHMGGFSYRRSDGHAISFGAGLHAKELITLDGDRNLKTVDLLPTAGIFVDRNHSLLFSMVYSGLHESALSINLYPGVVSLGSISPSLWGKVSRDGQVFVGVGTRWAPGVGFSF